MNDQREAESDQKRIFDADFFMSFHDKLKKRPVEQQAKDEHGRSDAEKRQEGVDLPKREEPERRIASQHQKLSVRDI